MLSALPAVAQSWSEAPKPPEGAAPNQAVPALDAQGGYLTPNRDLSPSQSSWHVRAALNVAALGCRDAFEAETIAGYNQLLALHRTALAQADTGVKALYRARHAAEWEGEHDRAMTRVYNFFAQPPAHDAFCAVEHEVLREALTVQPAAFETFALAALPRLEAPFTGFYRAYDAYRTALAGWRGGTAAVTMAAVAGPAARMPVFP
ncbi:hypothetical protein [Sphingomonas xinjiangensis]|uniref:Putative coiled-coil protein SlyX n=1 Tax=Sphingomonas xinjiangensis TaxID=643568 RepID=A0A840YR67_9SPHN|nr:hypothetical protein [Sphingomonas xinjiangensis]MBB5711273.1 putative coiled-coil protein SlyX [Sphingomonas xinjiangensis]